MEGGYAIKTPSVHVEEGGGGGGDEGRGHYLFWGLVGPVQVQ